MSPDFQNSIRIIKQNEWTRIVSTHKYNYSAIVQRINKFTCAGFLIQKRECISKKKIAEKNTFCAILPLWTNLHFSGKFAPLIEILEEAEQYITRLNTL